MVIVVVMSVAFLGYATVVRVAQEDWHVGVTVDGVQIDRKTMRERLEVFTYLAAERTRLLDHFVRMGQMTEEERTEVLGRFPETSDPATAAVDDIVIETVLRRELAERLIAIPEPMGWLDLAAARTEGMDLQVVWFELTGSTGVAPVPSEWPSPPPEESDRSPSTERALLDRLRQALVNDTPIGDLVSAVQAAGWRARGGRSWVGPSSPVGLVPTIVQARIAVDSLPADGVIGPEFDEVSRGWVVGRVVGRAPEADARAVEDGARSAGLTDGAVQAWAWARVVRELARIAIQDDLLSQPHGQVLVRDVVISASTLEGPAGVHADLSHLVTARLGDRLPATTRPGPVGSGGSGAARLARELRALPIEARFARFDELMDMAGRDPRPEPLEASGDIGYLAADAVVPTLGAMLVAQGIGPGDVIGPISTSVGEELFMVHGTFTGVLDDRARSALLEARQSVDLAAMADRINPGDRGERFTSGIWRSIAEGADSVDAQRALGEVAVGERTGPYVVDGELLISVVADRRSAVAAGQMVDRLRVHGFDRWLTGQLADVEVVLDTSPFGAPAPSATPTTTALPDQPTIPPAQTPAVVPPAGGATVDPFPIPTTPTIP